MSLLDTITGPAGVKKLNRHQLAELATEIRTLIIETVARNGGHLGSNLGVVEITLALHRVYDSPRDKIVFDTGHQAYVHKLLTGRQEHFSSLRQSGGLSGYPSRAESEHDLLENSHASVSLSYAEGLMRAFKQRGEPDRAVVVVIGDGALTAGVAWEAINNVGVCGLPLVIVLNDNGRSYCPTVGGLARHLAALRGADGAQLADMSDETPLNWPGPPAAASSATHTVFETLGFEYMGPVDGHDETAVEDALRAARTSLGPVVVHCVTRKGRGYAPAENDPEECFHSPGRFDPKSGRRVGSSGLTWTNVFSQELAALGGARQDLVAITAAMLYPTGLDAFAERYPKRVFDVGIAEQHAVALAAGLAFGGLHPVVALYSTFMNRAFDQVLLDVGLHRLPVTFVLDRAGITGDDGPSHHGIWDLALLGMVPGLRVAAPRDGARLRELLREAIATTSGPTAVRFPKGTLGPDIPPLARIGNADVLMRDGAEDVLLLAVGPTAAVAVEAAALLVSQGVGVTVLDPRWVKPLNPGVLDLAGRHRAVLVLEEGVETGGIGDALRRTLARRDPGGRGATQPVGVVGVPARFIPHDTRDSILDLIGLRNAAWLAQVAQGLLDPSPVAPPAVTPQTGFSLVTTLSGRNR